jgi:hypothetical protein
MGIRTGLINNILGINVGANLVFALIYEIGADHCVCPYTYAIYKTTFIPI